MIQPFHRRVFAFRRYSVEEDGRLVARTRNAGRDSYVCLLDTCRGYNPANIVNISRNRPYERPSRSVTIQPSNQGVPRTSKDGPPRKQVDGATLSRLFQQLAPLTKDPPNFESAAAVVCASFDLDPATSMEIITSFKQQLSVDESRGSKCVRGYFFRVLPLTSSSSLPAMSGPTTSGPIVTEISANTTTPAITMNTTPTPFKQQRPFCSGSPGVTAWYTTSSTQDITSPPPEITPEIGELHVHHNRVTDIHQVWLYGADHQWKSVTEQEKVCHPAISDRMLSMRANGTPNWITAASFTTIRGRKGKGRVLV